MKSCQSMKLQREDNIYTGKREICSACHATTTLIKYFAPSGTRNKPKLHASLNLNGDSSRTEVRHHFSSKRFRHAWERVKQGSYEVLYSNDFCTLILMFTENQWLSPPLAQQSKLRSVSDNHQNVICMHRSNIVAKLTTTYSKTVWKAKLSAKAR